MDPNAPSYIERAADAQLLAALIAGEYVFLLDSRQKGKSSMVARTIVKLREKGIATVKLDLQRIGANVTPEQWYAGMLNGIGQELNLTEALFEYWESHAAIGPLARWVGALQEVVLAKVSRSVVLFIDEIDFVRALSFSTDEFFAAIRDCYNRRADVAGFKRLAFCLVGVATPGQLIRNPEITPFNIGTRIELTDFTEADLAPFARALSQNGRDGAALCGKVYDWVRGHPYLTQLLCSRLMGDAENKSVNDLVSSGFLGQEARQSEPNFSDVERRLLNPDVPGLSDSERRTQILELYRRLLKGKPITTDDENPLIATLKLSGVSREAGSELVIRNKLYGSVFNEAWVRSSLPEAEKRRQHRAARAGALKTATVSAVLLAVIASFATYTWRLSVERSKAVENSNRLFAESERGSYISSLNLLSEQASKGNWIRASELLDRTRSSQTRGWEWRYWNARLNGHERAIKSKATTGMVVFLRDSTLATLTNGSILLSSGKTITLPGISERNLNWYASAVSKLDSGELDQDLLAPDPAIAFRSDYLVPAVSRDQQMIAFSNYSKKTFLVSKANGEALWQRRIDAPSNIGASFSIDGERIAYWQPGGIDLYAADSGRHLLHIPTEGADSVKFSPDGRLLAAASRDYCAYLYNSHSGKALIQLRGHISPVRSVEFSPDGTVLASSSSDGTIRIWSVPSGEPLHVLVGHRAAVTSCAFSSDSGTLASRSEDGEVRIWQISHASSVKSLALHADQIPRLELSPDGSRMATSSKDATVLLYDLDQEKPVRRIDAGPIARAHAITFSEKGTVLAVSLRGGNVGLFDARSGDLRLTLRGHTKQVTRVQFCDGDSKVFSASEDGTARVWSTLDGQLIRNFDYSTQIETGAIDRTGRFVALAFDDFSIGLFSTRNGDQIQTWRKHTATIYAVEFSPKSDMIAATSYDNTASLYSVSGRDPRVLVGHTGRVWEVQFSPDGNSLLTNSYDATAIIWDVRSGRKKAVMRHDSWVAWAEFSPDQSRVISSSADNTVRIWDPETGDELTALRGHTQVVFRARMSRDQRFIASASSDGTVRIWSTRSMSGD